MTRRETYPCAKLENVITTTELVLNNFNTKNSLLENNVTKDDIRLTELLHLIESVTVSTKNYRISSVGKKLVSYDEYKKKVLLFCLLMRENKILPRYFNQLINNKKLYDKNISTKELSHCLNMNDLWSADILNEWCRYLDISQGKSKSEVKISIKNVNKLKEDAFKYVLQQSYNAYVGPSHLVPVSKIRNEIKNSGIMGPLEDFDEMLNKLSVNNKRINFYPAPAKFVGIGLGGKRGSELISITGELI